MKNLFFTQKIKTPSSSSLHNSELMNSSADQSRGDSNSKRFARKQGHHLQNSRNNKTPRMTDSKINLALSRSKPSLQPAKINYISSGFIRQEDLCLKICQTPSKSLLSTPESSDRAPTESTMPNNFFQSKKGKGDIETTKKKGNCDIEEQLQIRLAEIMMLEDENMKLKGEISFLQSQHLKLRLAQEKQHQKAIKKWEEQLEKLTKEIADKNEQIKKFTKIEVTLNRELKGVKYDKLMLQKQLQQIYKKRLPKEFKQLMSYREISLMHQVQELKEELKKEKTEKQKSLEQQIGILKLKNSEKQSTLSKLEIQAHTLQKKIVDTQEQIKKQEQEFNKCFNSLQDTNSNLVEQLKMTRKENLKLHRLNILTKQASKKSTSVNSEDSDTLSFSISPRSPRIK